MSGPPVRDQKLAPSQLVGLPPDVTRTVFLRTQQLLLTPASRPPATTGDGRRPSRLPQFWQMWSMNYTGLALVRSMLGRIQGRVRDASGTRPGPVPYA